MTRRVQGFDRERLAELRTDAGYSPAELARLAGIGVATLRQWESGHSSPQVELLGRVAKALGVPVSELVAVPVSKRFPSYYRILAGMSQPQLGLAAGTPTSTIQAIERTEIDLSDTLAKRIAGALGIPVPTFKAAYTRASNRDPGTPA